MGSINKLLRKMHKTRKEFNKRMEEHIKDLDKIRQIVKYNFTPNGQQKKKDEGTLSVPASGVTKQMGIKSQDDTKLQFERSASSSVDTHSADFIQSKKELFDKCIEWGRGCALNNEIDVDKLIKTLDSPNKSEGIDTADNGRTVQTGSDNIINGYLWTGKDFYLDLRGEK